MGRTQQKARDVRWVESTSGVAIKPKAIEMFETIKLFQLHVK